MRSILALLFIATASYPALAQKFSRPIEPQVTNGISCGDLGYKWGRCSALSLIGKPCHQGEDFAMPARCNASKEWSQGLSKGVKEIVPNGVNFVNGKAIKK